MLALGVDPGTLHLGWGLVRREGNRLRHVAHGVVHLPRGEPLQKRLAGIAEALADVLDAHRPEVSAVETLFFHKDAQAAAKLGHARGVVLLCLARAGLDVAEYSPARVKRAIAGHGRADKRQMSLMVRALLGLAEPPPSDAADALALAITCLRAGPLMARLEPAARGLPPRLAEALAARGRKGRISGRGAGR
ncbi:MAG: crossover junction endodeoxyribonuclease RuvC [Pseudomonadota bacterium]|nr:MAG: crossover junction endodeoxyribonuclease RuvC [Pseudomonadota bacterium]